MSIRRYLTLILLSVITLITFAAALQGYRSSMQKASAIFDHELTSLAGIFANYQGGLQASPLPVKDSGFIYQIWQGEQLLSSSHPSQQQAISQFEQGFAEQNILALRWRTYSDYDTATQQWIMVAQPLNRRFELAEQMILAAVTPLVLCIPLLAIIIYFIISLGLRPLRNLADNLASKKINDLSAIQPQADIKELTPVIHTINQLFDRLDAAYTREKRFASDAAHELRTPLSVLKINIHNLAQELAAADTYAKNLADLELGIERMGHVIEQILLLNRTNPDQYRGNFTRINSKKLCQNVIASIYPQLENKHQEIELAGQNFSLLGDEFSLGILLLNLISNASKYSPAHAKISVQLLTGEQQVTIKVEDSGPGIDSHEFERIFERFYRIGSDRHTSNQVGCGLGLAIAKHIAQLHNAKFKLAKSTALGGLSIAVIFKINSGLRINLNSKNKHYG